MRILFRGVLAPLFLLAATGVQAQTNDDWANRIQITTLPYEIVTPMSGATNAASDPLPACQTTNESSYGTIWFAYTTGAVDEFLTLRAKDAQIGALIGVYTGNPTDGFRLAPGACAVSGSLANNAQLAGVRLAANTEYSILLSALSPPSPGLSSDFSVTAATLYHVTKFTDSFDGACGADCSLRDAVEAANNDGGAVILGAGTYVLSIPIADTDDNSTGDLNIGNDMGIFGAGMGQTIIDAGGIDRVISVTPGGTDTVTLILGDLTLTHGNSPSVGGAINNQPLAPGFLGLERVALVDNHAAQSGGGLDTATAGTVRQSRFTLNSVDTAAGGGGGGIQIFNLEDRPFEIESSTFDDNDGGKYGGAIQQGGGNLRVTNSTISGNHVSQNGGGIRVYGGHFEMSSTTVAFNRAGNDPYTNIGGGLFLDSSIYAFTLYNNIVAGNIADDCSQFVSSAAIDSHHNHVQNAGACTFAGTGDVVGTDPQLGPLADNGGPTPTHALGYKSPARDAGDPAGCNAPGGLPLTNDQRGAGFPRVDGPACDKGAYEQQVLFANGFEP